MMRRFAVLALTSLVLAACGNEAETQSDGDGNQAAEGEILGGTISDDMIPLDQLRSQSPALERVETVTTTSETSEDGADSITTTVETSVSVTTGDQDPPPPEPPAAPQQPEE